MKTTAKPIHSAVSLTGAGVPQQLRAVNAGKDYARVRNVLLLVDLDDVLVYYEEEDFIRQLYLVLLILGHAEVQLVHRNKSGCRLPWEQNEGLADRVPFLSETALPHLDLLAYDVIISSYGYQQELLAVLQHRYGVHLATGTFTTAVYAFRNISGEFKFEDMHGLWSNKDGSLSIDDALKGRIKAFFREMSTRRFPYQRVAGEAACPEQMARIGAVNEVLLASRPQKILVLDDAECVFFIGDTCKWIHVMQTQYLQYFEGADVTINWQSETKYRGAAPVARHAFGPRVAFTNGALASLDPSAYDLVLCHEKVAGRLLWHLAETGRQPEKTALYYYLPDPWISATPQDDYGWNFKKWLREQRRPEDVAQENLKSIKKIRNFSFSPLVLQAEEQAWGAARLAELGVESHQQVVILPDSSSQPLKDLAPEEYAQVLAWLAGLAHTKVLLFDPTGSGKRERLAARLSPSLMERVVVVEGGSLRGSMCLLGAPQVRAVIGPCTGLLHLANGIYTHYLQAGLTGEQDLPLLLTYVGAQRPDYSPWNWWAKTRVACLVHWLDAQGEPVLRPLAECPREASRFGQGALPAGQITARLLIDALRQRYLHQLLPRPETEKVVFPT